MRVRTYVRGVGPYPRVSVRVDSLPGDMPETPRLYPSLPSSVPTEVEDAVGEVDIEDANAIGEASMGLSAGGTVDEEADRFIGANADLNRLEAEEEVVPDSDVDIPQLSDDWELPTIAELLAARRTRAGASAL